MLRETIKPRGRGEYRGRTWVTRKGIHVDRMASAWLIRRFIDLDAKFKFVPARLGVAGCCHDCHTLSVGQLKSSYA